MDSALKLEKGEARRCVKERREGVLGTLGRRFSEVKMNCWHFLFNDTRELQKESSFGLYVERIEANVGLEDALSGDFRQRVRATW